MAVRWTSAPPLRTTPLDQVDFHISESEYGYLLGSCGDLPAQDGADTGEQLADAERLGQIVIGARIEGLDLVGLVDPRREHDHRDRRPAAQIADEIDAVAVGQAEVENDDVGLAGSGFDESVLERLGLEHMPTLGLERGAHESAGSARSSSTRMRDGGRRRSSLDHAVMPLPVTRLFGRRHFGRRAERQE